jgi:cystathionine beta-lyase
MRSVTDRLPYQGQWRVGQLGLLATVAAFTDDGRWLDALLATLDARRTQLGDLLAERLPRVRWSPPEATYLSWLDLRAYGHEDPAAVVRERASVVLAPGHDYHPGLPGHVRLNFATSTAVLTEAVQRMGAAVRALG